MSFVDKILSCAHKQLVNSVIDHHSLFNGDSIVTINDADNDSVFDVTITKGWSTPVRIKDVFAPDLLDTIMKGVKL